MINVNQKNNAQAPINALFPTTNFPLTLEKWDAVDITKVIKREIVWCSYRTSDVFTITRSYDYCPSSWNALTHTNTAFSFDPGDTITL